MSKKHKKAEPVKSEPKATFDLAQETKNSIWAVFSFGLVILSGLAFFNKAGAAGEIFSNLARSLFGWGFFLIPLAFLILGVSFIKSVSRKIYTSAILGTLLFVLSFLAIFYILGGGDFQIRVVQGGYFGAILGFPALKAFCFIASFIGINCIDINIEEKDIK